MKIIDQPRVSARMILRLISLVAVGLLPVATVDAENVLVPGITEPIFDSALGTQVNGIIVARKFKEGDFVQQGEVIIELDKALEQLEVARREVVLEPLKADYEAAKYLFEQPRSSVSKELLDKKHSDYKVALAEYELAKEQVRKRSITAPFAGFITDFYFQVGEACHIEQPVVARLVDTRRGYFVCNVDARTGHGLTLGQKVDLEIEAGASAVHLQGTLSFVSPVVDPASGLMKVKAIFENADGKIRPGVAGKMILPVPNAALAQK